MHAMATGWLIINISLYYHRMDTCHELGGCTLIKQPRITIGIAPPHTGAVDRQFVSQRKWEK